MVTQLMKLLGFRYEKDLEDYLETRLWLTGQDLLVIGRQVKISGGEVDLLAIDSTGLLHIVELKRDEAKPSVIGQILHYRHSLKQLKREELIHVVGHGDRIDLAVAFQQRFGHPLPETVNESPALMIIGESIHPQTAGSILELRDWGCSVTAFRYEIDKFTGVLSLVPCCRSDQDMIEGTHKKKSRSVRPGSTVAGSRRPACRVPIDENVRRFWLTNAQDFTPFVTFRFVYDRYSDWVHARADEGVHLYQDGLFARQLSAITAERGEWTRVYIAPQDNLAAYDMPRSQVSAQPYRAMGHTRVAYRLNPIGPVSDP